MKNVAKRKERKARKKLKSTRKQVVEISEGLVSKVVDITLFLVFFNAEYGFGGRPSPGGVWQANDKAFADLEKVNYDSIKRALYELKKKGLVKLSGRGNKVGAQITKQGLKRLEAIVPFYDEKRVWDEKIYLVTYDIPERQRDDRELLRRYLRKIGCGRFQESVWLTPYNPTGVLRNFIFGQYPRLQSGVKNEKRIPKEDTPLVATGGLKPPVAKPRFTGDKNLSGAVVVSCIGKDGDIGQENVRDLVVRVFQLEELNDRYRDYLEEFGGGGEFAKSQAVFGFLAILNDDPQLPFELLPSNWVGGEAYILFKEICSE